MVPRILICWFSSFFSFHLKLGSPSVTLRNVMLLNRSVATSHLSMWRIQTDRTTHSLPTNIRRASKETLSQGTGNSDRGRERTSRRFSCNGKLNSFLFLFFCSFPHSSLSLDLPHKSNSPRHPSCHLPHHQHRHHHFHCFQNIISWGVPDVSKSGYLVVLGSDSLVVRYAETYTANFLILWNCLRWEDSVRTQIIFSWVRKHIVFLMTFYPFIW